MFASVIAIAAVAGSIVSAAPVAQRAQPSGWATGYLEDYNTYHARYLALDCQDKHNTTFFDDCCHPLLATESLSDRPSYCTPSDAEVSSVEASISSTSVAYADATAVPTSTDSAAVDAQTEYAAAASSSASFSSSASSSTVDNNEGYATPTSSSTWSSAAAAATSSASSSGSSSNVETGGYATFFYQGGNAGACGTVHADSDLIIAIDIDWYGNTGSASQYCGKSITIENTDNSKTVTAVVADVCPTCTNSNSLDLSVGAFTAIASESDGLVPIKWWFN